MPESVSSSTLSFVWLKIKRAASIALALLGVLLAAVVIAPQFVDRGLLKRNYLPRVEEALHRRLDVGEVQLSLVPLPSIRLTNLKVFNRPESAQNTFFAAQQVRLRLRFWPLLRGRFEVSELVLDRPIFNVSPAPDGTFNDSKTARKKSAASRHPAKKRAEATDSTSMLLSTPVNLTIRDGQFNVITKGHAPVNLKGIDLSLRDFSSAAPFPFRASFRYPGLKTVALEGELDYQKEKSLVEFKNNRLRINELTLPVQGSVRNLNAIPRLSLDLRSAHIDAKPIFQILSAVGLAPSDTEIAGPVDLTLNVSGPSNNLVTRVRGLFKDVRVQGKGALKGRLSGEVSLHLPMGSGPASRRLHGNGKLAAHDGELTHVDLIRKIERVTGLIGLTRDERREATTFSKMEADFTIGGGYAEFTRLYLVNPQMEVTGDGTMTIEQPALNVAISTALSPQASARVGRGRLASYFKDKQGRIVLPLKLRGPVENPSVDLNAGKLASDLPRNVENGFNSFFKRLFSQR